MDKRLKVEKTGSTPLFAETELKLLKHKDTLNHKLRGRSTYSSFQYSSFQHSRGRYGKGYSFRSENGKGKGKGKGKGYDKPFHTERVAEK